ncbi:MAG: site-specific integrase [Deltaproteobacteria bacterium]|nr:site-specific integrase [Deltaproteobacteria bacterium]
MLVSASRPSSAHSPYLSRHRNSLIFRIRIPADLQTCLGKTEYRRSIGRCYAAEAKRRAFRLAAAAFEVFSFARQALERRAGGLTHDAISGNEYGLMGYTPINISQRKSPVTQDNSSSSNGYTSEFQGRALSSLTDEEIRAIADTWLLAALKGSDLFALQTAHIRNQATPTIKDLEYRAGADATTAANLKNIYLSDLKARSVGRMAQEADKQLAVHGIDCDPETESCKAFQHTPPQASPAYLKTCQELLKAQVTFYEAAEQTAQGEYAAHDTAIEALERRQEARKEKRRDKSQQRRENASKPTPAVKPSPKLSEAIIQYLDQRTREKKRDDLSRRRTESKFALFQAVIDPEDALPVNMIGAQHLQAYRKVLFGFPANRRKKRQYRDIPLPLLLEEAEAGRIPEEDRIDRQTIITYCQPVIAFLKWAGTNEYHFNSAIANNLNVEKPERTEEEERDPYTAEDIRKLFTPASFLTAGMRQAAKIMVPDSGGKASRYWVPLLGLFTGARLEELSQLHLDDIVLVDKKRNRRRLFTLGQPMPDVRAVLDEAKQAEETPCIFINDSKGYQRLKNKPSRRYVPLSSILVDDLNFLGYVARIFQEADEAQRRNYAPEDNGRLFPELKKTASSNKYGHKLSHWYGQYRERVGIVSGEYGEGKKVFHSFRHTISDWCMQQQDIQETAAISYLGHKQGSITFDIYAKGTLPHVLYSSITAPFSEYVRPLLDIDGLKQSVWAGKTLN